jgi:hypothetical protein
MTAGPYAPGWAQISENRMYRYALTRCWGDGPLLGWIMLNPSSADATHSDRTADQVAFFSRREGYGGFWAANLHALRTPSPAMLRKHRERAGPDCDAWLARMLAEVPAVVLAWGTHGGENWARERRDAVLRLVRDSGVPAWCLGLTRGGEPVHPCRLARATALVPYSLPVPEVTG